LALFWEKCGITRDHALRMLKEAITEAMLDGVKEDDHIQSRIKDVDAAIKAVRTELIAQLPKMRRNGKVITRDLAVTVMVATEQPVLAVA
jgi:20S proteasome alpha/beta subunit